MSKERKTLKKSVWIALIPIVSMMILFIVGYGMYHITPQVLLIAAGTIPTIIFLDSN